MIRFAQSDDLPGILALYAELRPHDPVLPAEIADTRWKAVLGEANIRVVVADLQGMLAATCMIALVPNLASGGRPFAVIEHVVTLSAFRGRGLGKAVLQHALDFAWSRDCCKVMLLSGAQRLEAHRLYESLGFRGDVERGFVMKPK
jgi:GNAT superfamily N-acetyltransferase